MLNQSVHETGECWYQFSYLHLHLIFSTIYLPFKFPQWHHLMHQTLAVYVASMLNTKYCIFFTASVHSDEWLLFCWQTTLQNKRIFPNLLQLHNYFDLIIKIIISAIGNLCHKLNWNSLCRTITSLSKISSPKINHKSTLTTKNKSLDSIQLQPARIKILKKRAKTLLGNANG